MLDQALLAWLDFPVSALHVEAQAACRVVAYTIILALKILAHQSFLQKSKKMYMQKYPRLVNLLPDCRKSVFLKSLKWFQNQLKISGYSGYTIFNP